MPAPQTEVLITVDGVEHARHVVEPGEYVLGRNPDCAVRVDADLVSRRHAKLTLNFDHALIEDLGSANGTFVNDAPIPKGEPTRLWPSQKIRIGAATVTLRRLAGEQPTDMSLAPAQAAIRRMLPAEMLREKKYDIGAVVARGGMGAILDAREAAIKRKVAMKVMLDTNDPADIARFVDEAQVTGQLEHPNIVPVHELGVDENGQPFYTMKMVRGITLKKVLDLMAAGTAATLAKYPLAALLTIFQKVCDALAFAHSKGVIHRDLKPENIMLGDYGEVLVMDWGLAKTVAGAGSPGSPAADLTRSLVSSARDTEPALSSTLAGTIMGTPQYMAPEQARGEVGTMDQRADIYALGAILYHILALRPPVEGKDAWDIVGKVGRGEIEPLECAGPPALLDGAERRGGVDHPPQAHGSPATAPPPAAKRQRAGALQKGRAPRRAIPDSLAAVVRKAMALDRVARYPAVADLQRDIEAYQGGFATGAENAGAWKLFTLFVRRHKAASIGVAAVLAVSLAFTAKVITEGRRAEAALADLRSAAPTLISQARGLIDEQKFDDALAKIDFAVKIDGKNAGHRLLRAQVLEATLRIAEAAAEFRRVLALGPNASAQANLALCEKLLRDHHAGGELDEPGLKALHELMIREQRTTQDVPIAARLGLGRAANDARIKALFDAWRKLPGWETMPEEKRLLDAFDGTVVLILTSLPISDISALKGIPISHLQIDRTKVEDLSPLAGMRLTGFHAVGTPISDLSPLRGMPLKSIMLAGCRKVEDLSPLAGMPLELCNLSQVQAVDFSPLKKCPIKELSVNETRITTLAAFAGMPCERLTANQARALVDISAVRTMRLKFAEFWRSTGIADLAPLAECPDLEQLAVPSGAKNLASLRRLTKLRSIRVGDDDATSPEELWVKLGIGDDRDRERAALIQKARAALVACGSTQVGIHLVKVLPDGTLDVVMNRPEFKTLAPLRGLPVSMLDIASSGVTDLSPLADMPLRRLNLARARIADLSPLAKCRKLENLTCANTEVRDFSPLAGLPLVFLGATSTKVSSIAPLAGMPLKELRLDNTPVSDLRPLLSCPALEWLILPPAARDVSQLRALKKLVRLSERYDANLAGAPHDRGGPAQTAEEFWKEYDTKQAAGKK